MLGKPPPRLHSEWGSCACSFWFEIAAQMCPKFMKNWSQHDMMFKTEARIAFEKSCAQRLTSNPMWWHLITFRKHCNLHYFQQFVTCTCIPYATQQWVNIPSRWPCFALWNSLQIVKKRCRPQKNIRRLSNTIFSSIFGPETTSKIW